MHILAFPDYRPVTSPPAQVPSPSPPPSRGLSLTTSPVLAGSSGGKPADEISREAALKKKEAEKAVDPLSSFSVSNSNGSSLVTAHIATAYSPAFLSSDTKSMFNSIGLDISASLPAESASLKQYAKQALLSLDGGVLNIYGSFAGRDRTSYTPTIGNSPNPRDSAFDHIYLIKNPVSQEQLLGYAKFGFGARGIKTALEGTGYAGLATAYLGLGLDGPLLSKANGTRDNNTGWVSVEGYGVANALNKNTLTTLFGEPYGKRSFSSLGAKVTIGLPGRFYLSAQYGKALGNYGKEHIGDLSVLSFGYNPTPATETRKQP